MSKAFVCYKSDIPPNGMKECSVGNGQKVLVLDSGGDYFACQATCPHQQVPLCEGFYDGMELTCYQHLWQWEIRTGSPIGLAEAPLEFYNVAVEGDSIFITDLGATLAKE